MLGVVACRAFASGFSRAVGVSGSPAGCERGHHCPRGCVPPGRRSSCLAGVDAPPRCYRVRLSRSFLFVTYGVLVSSPAVLGGFAEILWAPGFLFCRFRAELAARLL